MATCHLATRPGERQRSDAAAADSRRAAARLTLAALLIAFFLLAPSAGSQTLDFYTVLGDALEQSHDIRLSRVDFRLAHNEVKHAVTDYFPTLRGQAAMERMLDLTQGTSPVVVVGSTAIPNATRYQNAIYLSANWTVLDFGMRGQQVAAARKHRDAALAILHQARRDLKIQVIDAYADALVKYRALKAREKLREIEYDLYQMKKRLYGAGQIGRVDVAETALQLAKRFDDIHQARQELTAAIRMLSTYTHREYNPDSVQLQSFPEDIPAQPATLVVEALPEYRFYQAQIEAKKRELAALKRQRLPVFSLYSNFYMYGFDQDSWARALSTFKGRTIAFGIGASLPIFDGFKNKVECERKRLEVTRLEIERDKKVWEAQQRHCQLSTSVRLLNKQLELKDGVVNQGAEKVVMVQRLTDSQIAEKTAYLTQQARLIEDELERDRTRVERLAAAKKLQVLSEG